MIEYYDWLQYISSGTAATSDSSYISTGCAGTGYSTFTLTSGSASTSQPIVWYVPKPRTYYVSCPDHWADEDAIAFAHLINAETRTGYVVESIIKGDVLITDPSVERRTMAEVKPLLACSGASAEDLAKIKAFFDAHPTEAPAA